jgi:hypothetical protein
MRIINEQWWHPFARVASEFQALFTTQTSEMVNSVLRGLGGVAIPPGVVEQASTAINQLATGQISAAAQVAEALNASNTAALRDATNVFALTGDAAVTATAKQAIGIISAVERMPLPFDSAADSLVRTVANAAAAMTPSTLIRPYPLPAIHIRREPHFPSPEPEQITPSTQQLCTSRIGRPRGSYRWYPERVVQVYEELTCSGRYVSQERLARKLGVTLRTLQNWIAAGGMNLGWPPKL